MIFDADTHMSPFRKLPESANAEEWDKLMAEAGIDKAICWMMQQHLDSPAESNQYIYESAKKNPRIFPFGWIMLPMGLEKTLEEVDRCFEEYGFHGIKINGSQNKHNIDSDECMAVIERIAKHGKSVAFHTGAEAPVYTDPKRSAKIAKLFPEMNVIIVHMGGCIEPDMSADVIEAAKDCPNMYLVGSTIKMEKVANAIRILGPEQVMFGSDAPYHEHPSVYLAQYREMLKEFDERTSELVLGGNAKRIFKL